MKKKLAILLTALALTMSLSGAASAHGHHSRARTNCTYPVCTVANCTRTSRHTHSGKTFAPHSRNDGHAYHICGRTGCKIGTPHYHYKNGTYHRAHHGR